MTQKVVAIKHEIEDEATGAVANYHVIEYYAVDARHQSVVANINGYVSRKAYENGKAQLCTHTLTVGSAPPEDANVLQWLYAQAVLPDSSSVFAGAQTILA
ncbi:hypothetical protein [Wielerella bovis]|uniref:hypothetical protein n=1 Tax=Wielerella bovis TaxID=2917790 RepID=UPI002019FB8A|nr:hypothetical protein [Wielerella bovis]ULJ59732.1 hypothetical protein MIS44_08595 [Wielerella bovis]